MGYINDTKMSQWIPPGLAHLVTGTWTSVAGQVSNTIAKNKAAGDVTAIITIPIIIPSNSASYKGARLKSIDVYFEALTTAPTTLDALVHRVTLPANGAAIGTVESLAFSYDTGHDTAGERDNVDQHTMTLTLTTPIWIDDDEVIQVQLTLDAAAGGTFHLLGARANYDLRL